MATKHISRRTAPHPAFTGAAATGGHGAMRFGLSRVRALLALLGDPQKNLRFVHIAGTNGKGSTGAMAAAVLTAAGYRTGFFSSPALSAWHDQFRLDGALAPLPDLYAATARVRDCAQTMADQPTVFEKEVATAFLYYKEQRCDLVFLEAGLGGRLDATNVIDAPDVAVLTALGLDHRKELGATLSLVAAEKAGIIKKNALVLLYPQPPQVLAVLTKKCAEVGISPRIADFSGIVSVSASLDGQTMDLPGYPGLLLPLLGVYQSENAVMAVETADLLRQRGFIVPKSAVYTGLKNVRWPGRFEIVHRAPTVVLDGGHNPQGARALARSLSDSFPGQKIRFIVGLFADKDYPAMMAALAPLCRRFYVTAPESPRALPADALAHALKQYGRPVQTYAGVAAALTAALSEADASDILCVTGSLSLAASVHAYFS